MISSPFMLEAAAKEAEIKVPPLDQMDNLELFHQDYPHFFCFCVLQLGRRMTPVYQHWDNAKVIASISEDKIKEMTVDDFVNAGFNMD